MVVVVVDSSSSSSSSFWFLVLLVVLPEAESIDNWDRTVDRQQSIVPCDCVPSRFEFQSVDRDGPTKKESVRKCNGIYVDKRYHRVSTNRGH